MSSDHQHLALSNVGLAFDHPEAVAWGPDGRAYAGGEAGQLYRFTLDGSALEEVARVAGGFLLGLAHDAGVNTYACDDRSACVHRITPDGKVTVYAAGNAEQKMRVPNYPVFDDGGNLYVSDSGTWGARDGFIWKVAPGGTAMIWDRQACAFPNGMCLSADGRWLYVVESCPPLVSRIAINSDGSAGARVVVVELPRQVPDGLALDENGDLYISLYNPNIIYRLTTGGELITLYDDWEQLMLVAPTNIAFGGGDRKTLIIASLCGWSVHTAPMPAPGLRLRYPEL
ncbi:SMP-30/gluconolactonase/LRE family protein [Mesorhizobium sp. AR07]|uniref:SMP-30/gluconolactonase/LRE family protein n=1 Tax=Mesorhizobium sp. AR07 TaxID=2865838 RepID=UPI00215FCD80|nr:SMP-30/gluconolactonase/LRE family protein [Mesorhizobium sp. AR07]UVK43869.1 SMP-30/gluconolactonase/LRE family protein [Mesorhizobium sp. AR07]